MRDKSTVTIKYGDGREQTVMQNVTFASFHQGLELHIERLVKGKPVREKYDLEMAEKITVK